MNPARIVSTRVPTRRRSRQGGFTLIEVMIAGVVLVVAALGFAASVTTAHALASAVEEHSLAIETMQRLVERLRADPDWDGLYARLKAMTSESSGDTTLSWKKVDTSLTTYPLTTYYSDLVAPSGLGSTVTCLVQVPVTTVSGVGDLRENATAPRYGLPADLNGDGAIDGNARSGDYRSIPIVVRLRWKRAARDANEVVLATWLRGDR